MSKLVEAVRPSGIKIGAIVRDGCCAVCEEYYSACLAADSSGGEYGYVWLCKACIEDLFLEHENQEEQGDE